MHELHASGHTSREIASETGISRGTIRKWIRDARAVHDVCLACGREPHRFDLLPAVEYAYLLGMYLGDGSIAKLTKGVWALRIYQDTRYPGIVHETVQAVQAVMPQNSVSVSQKEPGVNCVIIVSSSRAWPCYFPQAGPGMKHTRKIELTDWQWAIVRQEPEMFLRGLIHSDGCRVSNKVWHGKYEYPRYFFSNRSEDIQQLFRDACDLVGVEYRNNNRFNISVARRESVARLDEFVGPKR